MEYFISFVLGYSIGSVPTAYLLLKKLKGMDITVTGSGNVGAMNSYESTGSKMIGLIVLIIDAIKGIIPVLIMGVLFESVVYQGTALIFAVLGHCYSPWLKFKGGRGLATAAGGCAVIAPVVLVIWAVLWVIFYSMKKDIHFGNIFATLMTLFLLFYSSTTVVKYSAFDVADANSFILFAISLLIIILIKHAEPLSQLSFKKNME